MLVCVNKSWMQTYHIWGPASQHVSSSQSSVSSESCISAHLQQNHCTSAPSERTMSGGSHRKVDFPPIPYEQSSIIFLLRAQNQITPVNTFTPSPSQTREHLKWLFFWGGLKSQLLSLVFRFARIQILCPKLLTLCPTFVFWYKKGVWAPNGPIPVLHFRSGRSLKSWIYPVLCEQRKVFWPESHSFYAICCTNPEHRGNCEGCSRTVHNTQLSQEQQLFSLQGQAGHRWANRDDLLVLKSLWRGVHWRRSCFLLMCPFN